MIYSLAWHYHDLACNLFGKLKPGSYSWSPANPASEAVKKHIGDEKGAFFNIEERLSLASKSLAAAKPSTNATLARALSLSIGKRLDSLEDDLSFLTRDNPHGMAEAEMIFHVQAWKFLFSDEARGSLELKPGEKLENVDDALKLLKQHWKPPIRSNPVARWRVRSERLQDESDQFKALRKHEQLSGEMKDFETTVQDSAISLDRFIDIQVDLRRGK